MAEISYQLYARGSAQVPMGATIVLDKIPLVDFVTLDFILSFKNSDESITKSLRLGVNKQAGVVSDTTSGRLGGPLNIEISAIVETGDLKLKIKNNEVFDITASFARAKL